MTNKKHNTVENTYCSSKDVVIIQAYIERCIEQGVILYASEELIPIEELVADYSHYDVVFVNEYYELNASSDRCFEYRSTYHEYDFGDIEEVDNNSQLTQIDLKVLDKRLITNKDFGIPNYSAVGDAGMDLRAMFEEGETLTIKANETILIPTGVSIFINNPYICATILPRSGLGHKHGIVVGNLTGVIDSQYQGPLMISCWNRSDKDYTIQLGERIAQLMFLPVIQASFNVVEEFDNDSERGEGFGSSGKK